MSVNSTLMAPARPRSSFRRAMIVTRREIRDTLRDWRIVTPIVTLVVALPLLLALVLTANSTFLIKQLTPETFYNKLLPFTMLAIGFLPMSFCLVIALETFVGEKERNSLEALLSAPLTDLELFMGKYISATLPTVFASATASVTFYVVMALSGLQIPISAGLALTFVGLNVLEALVMVAGAVLVSTHTTSVRAANIMASFIIIPMSLAVQAEAILLLNGLNNGMYFMLLGLIVILLMLLRSGVKIFNREEIVAREGDNVSLKGVLSGFSYFFKRTPREGLTHQKTGARWTPWRLYRHDIPQIIGLNKGASALLGICLLGAIVLGVWLSYWPEVQQVRQEYNLGQQISANQTNPTCVLNSDGTTLQAAGFGAVTWQRLFINNSFAVVFASLASVVTLGLAGIAMLMVSIGPIGFIIGLLLQADHNPLPLLAGFVLPHGIFELTAVIIGISGGIRMGNAIISPPRGLTIGQSVQFSIINFVKLMALVIPMLLIAAIIEANLTPTIGCAITGGKF